VPTIGFVRSGVLPQIVRVLCVATTILDAGWLGGDLRGFSDIAGDSLMTTRDKEEITCESNGRWRSAGLRRYSLVTSKDVGVFRVVFPAAADNLLCCQSCCVTSSF